MMGVILQNAYSSSLQIRCKTVSSGPKIRYLHIQCWYLFTCFYFSFLVHVLVMKNKKFWISFSTSCIVCSSVSNSKIRSILNLYVLYVCLFENLVGFFVHALLRLLMFFCGVTWPSDFTLGTTLCQKLFTHIHFHTTAPSTCMQFDYQEVQ